MRLVEDVAEFALLAERRVRRAAHRQIAAHPCAQVGHVRRAAVHVRDRPLAARDRVDLLLQHLAEHHDPAIGRAEVLARTIEDRALRLDRHRILAHERVHQVAARRVGARRLLDDLRRLVRGRLRAVRVRRERHPDDPRRRIVDRHAPVHLGHDPQHVREHHQVAPATALAFVFPALHDAPVEALEAEPLERLAEPGRVAHAEVLEVFRVRIEGVRDVDRVFLHLEPVAREIVLHLEMADAVVAHEDVPVRKRGLLLRRPHVCEDQPAAFVRRVAVDQLLADAARLRRFERPLHAFAGRVVLPAVIRAADRGFLDEAVQQRCTAMRATLLHEQHAAVAGAREHQILAENPHAFRLAGFGQLRRITDRMPVATQQLAARRAGPHAGQQFVGGVVKHEYTSLSGCSGLYRPGDVCVPANPRVAIRPSINLFF
ncbi:hypothetical protein BamIOP4010DRAFT_5497 [Burkholderia ambifaria IOP40-10]|uniref:Uncharacterized protein n=1 Tax=Burkholderia ambifaria IOP40-10 TaxID=396596 RepID=B1FN86_9BURK|nr:hypothetical protein BamIOP4010DRAFT_5497 [Burkholderia ambifaria IOP40-10]